MAKKRKIILSVVSLIAAIVIGWWFISSREPSYNGRSLSEWADIGLKATDTAPWDIPNVLLASNAIHQIGTNSFPWIRRSMLNKGSNQVRVLVWLQEISMVPDEFQRMVAAPLIHRMEQIRFVVFSVGEIGLPLFPEFSGNTIPSQEDFVVSIGSRALPALIPMLTNGTPGSQTDLARRLIGFWRTNAIAAGPYLWSIRESNYGSTNESTWLQALAGTGYRSEELSKMLVARIRSDAKPPDYAKQQIVALARIPRLWAPSLVSLLDHPEPAVQQHVLLSLFGKYAGRETEFLPIFRLQISDGPLGSSSMSLNHSASNALREASVPIRLAAVRIGLESYAGSSSNGWYLSLTDTKVFISGLTNDPDKQVVRGADKALEEFRALEKP